MHRQSTLVGTLLPELYRFATSRSFLFLFTIFAIFSLLSLSSCREIQIFTQEDRIFSLENVLPEVARSDYYYNLLNDADKEIYIKILSGLEAYSEKIILPYRDINETMAIFGYVLNDNPLIFYTNSFTQSSDNYKKDCTMKPHYTNSKSYISDQMITIAEYLQDFDIASGKSDLEKEQYVHDFCLQKYKYGKADSESAHNILGPILHKKAVCEGIAEFVKLALDYLNVKNVLVSGEANNGVSSKMESHLWNIVYIDNSPFHLDVTFDLSLTNDENRYDYFNLPDTEIQKDHIYTDPVPICSTTGKDYYSLHNMSINSESELERYITKNLKQGNKSFVVKIKNVYNTTGISDRVLSIALKQYVDIFEKSVRGNINYNMNQMVFELTLK